MSLYTRLVSSRVASLHSPPVVRTGPISEECGKVLRLIPQTDIYSEGLQLRSLKIYEAGKRNETLWQIIHDNLRFAEAALGDLRAQIASCNLGTRRYSELLARYGQKTVESCIATIWNQAEAAARAVVEAIPDGTYDAESFLDNDGRNIGIPIRIKVAVIIRGSEMTVDFTGTNPQTASALNSGRSGGIAAARIAFKKSHLAKDGGQRRLSSTAKRRVA